MSEARQATPADIDLVELRVGLAGLTAEVQRMRADMAPLAGLPLQLQAVADLQAERLTNHIATHDRDTADLRADLADSERRMCRKIEGVEEWQTWAIRLCLAGLVALALAAVKIVGA